MADSPTDRGTGDDASLEPDRGSTTGTPRWVKVSAIVAIVFVLLLVVMLLTGGAPGGHGPGRHTGSGDGDDRAPPARVTEDRSPSGGDPAGHASPRGVPRHGAQRP